MNYNIWPFIKDPLQNRQIWLYNKFLQCLQLFNMLLDNLTVFKTSVLVFHINLSTVYYFLYNQFQKLVPLLMMMRVLIIFMVLQLIMLCSHTRTRVLPYKLKTAILSFKVKDISKIRCHSQKKTKLHIWMVYSLVKQCSQEKH